MYWVWHNEKWCQWVHGDDVINQYSPGSRSACTYSSHTHTQTLRCFISIATCTSSSLAPSAPVHSYQRLMLLSIECFRCPARTVGFSGNTPVLVHLQPTKPSDTQALPTSWLGENARGLQPGGHMHKEAVHLFSQQPASITSSGAFKPEYNGLSQFREDTGPFWECNLIACPLLRYRSVRSCFNFGSTSTKVTLNRSRENSIFSSRRKLKISNAFRSSRDW